jgi:hypothetical protein
MQPFSDEDRYTEEWENSDELQGNIDLDDYIYRRQVEDYGWTADDVDNEC